MQAAKRKNIRRITLVLSVCFATSISLNAQYLNVKPLVNDKLSQAQKLDMIVKKPAEVLQKFGSKQYYMPSLGQFCIWEEKLSKAANRPIKIRLGDQDYVDKLENKRN